MTLLRKKDLIPTIDQKNKGKDRMLDKRIISIASELKSLKKRPPKKLVKKWLFASMYPDPGKKFQLTI